MDRHFAAIAPRYRDMRTTDQAPMEFIRRFLGRGNIRAADIGCGDGRYSFLLLRNLPRLRLLCIDSNSEMLEELKKYLQNNGYDDRHFEAIIGTAENFFYTTERLDAIFAFNAIHHFDFPQFLRECRLALGPGGHVFIYTRTRSQNARSVWGRHFPGFSGTETRLYETDEMERLIAAAGGFRVETEEYVYPRIASLDRLLDQARAKHYSTFVLYPPKDLEQAIEGFERNLRTNYTDTGKIAWEDGNVMTVMKFQA